MKYLLFDFANCKSGDLLLTRVAPAIQHEFSKPVRLLRPMLQTLKQ